MKDSFALANCGIVLMISVFPARLAVAEGSASATPPAKLDPIEANDPKYSAKFDELYQKTWGGGAIPEKYKQLAGVSISIVQRCDTCLGWHMKQAVRLGAKKDELVEAIRLGLLTGGSITVPTVRKAYELLDDLKVK
jgi:AhpD family alkylhydroperoxidase